MIDNNTIGGRQALQSLMNEQVAPRIVNIIGNKKAL
jgi:hypothetical protein